jgi:hypothetical protein
MEALSDPSRSIAVRESRGKAFAVEISRSWRTAELLERLYTKGVAEPCVARPIVDAVLVNGDSK